MWKFLLLPIFICYSLNLIAQNKSNDLVKRSELKFYSEAETKYFEQITESNSNYFEALSSIDSTVKIGDIQSFQTRFESAVNKFDNSKWYSKKPSKKIKLLYDKIHDTFFDQYNLENSFADVFTTGKYNCVSATGIYALALEKLNIPYVIKEEPTHVYLIAYPNSEIIVVEATNPSSGYTQYSSTFKNDYVNNLIKMKMIGSKEANSSSKSQLFDKYFFTNKNIKLEELVAIQYSNDGLYKMGDQKFEMAFHQLEKSFYLNPNERTGYLMYISGASFISQLELESPKYIPMVLKLARYKDYGVKNEQIIAEYQQLLNQALFDNGNIEFNDTLFHKFKFALSDSTYKNSISYLYNYETGRYYFTKGNISLALEHMENAYRLKPKDLQVQSFLVSIIAQKATRMQDIVRISRMVEKYNSKYPNLIENYNFEMMMININLEMASFYYYTNKPVEAQLYLNKFENYETKEVTTDENLISKAYVSASMYYYKKGATSKAQKYVNQGLAYLPNDFNLIRLKKMMR